MKKMIILAAAAVLCATAASAQDKQYKPEAGAISLEIEYAPLNITTGGTSASLQQGFAIPEYGIKGRYFLSEKLAVRANLGFSTTSTKDKAYSINTGAGPNGEDVEEMSYSTEGNVAFSIAPGVEYHFGKYNRVSPYVGGGLVIGAGSSTTRTVLASGKTITKSPVFGMGIQAVTGVDVYICQGLYAGVELGLGWEYVSEGRGKTVVKDANNNKVGEPQKGTNATVTNTFGFFATPSLRIGWTF